MPTLLEIYKKIIRAEPGSRYYKIDFHIHSPKTGDWKGENVTVQEWLKKLKDFGYDIIIIADHGLNTLEFLKEYNKLINKEDYPKVLMGCEIQSKDRIHLHFVFEEDLDIDIYRQILQGYRISNDISSEIENNTDAKLIELLKKDKILLIPPHANISKGLVYKLGGHSREFIKDAKIRLINLPVTSVINEKLLDHPKCSLIKPDNRKLNRGFPQFLIPDKNSLGMIKISDAHSLNEIKRIHDECLNCPYREFCYKGINWVKLGEKSITALKQLNYDSANRIKIEKPNKPKHPNLIGIYIDDGFFKDQVFHFNPWLNILMGGRGTGKSLLIEIIKSMLFDDVEDFFEKNYLLEHKFVCNIPVNTKIYLFFEDQDHNIWLIERWVKSSEKKRNQEKSKITFSDRIFHKLNNDIFIKMEETYPKLDELINAKCQAEITQLAQKKKFSIDLLDNYIENKDKWIELQDLICEYLKSKDELINKYIDFRHNLQKLLSYHSDLESYQKIIENIDAEKSKSEYLRDLSLAKNKWKNGNDIFQQISNEISQLEFDYELLELKSSEELPEEGLGCLEEIINLYNQFNISFTRKQDEILEYIEKFKEEFVNITKKWESLYNHKIEKISLQLSNLGNSTINELEKDKQMLENRIKSYGNLQRNLRKNKKDIKYLIKILVSINRKIETKRKEINKLRKIKAKDINRILGEKYSIIARNKDSSVFRDSLKKMYGSNYKIDENILKLGPNLFFYAYFEDETLKKVRSRKNRSKIYDKFKKSCDESFWGNIDNQTEVRKLFNKKIYKVPIYDDKILSIPIIPFEDKLEIRLKKGAQYRPLEEGSMGEIIGTVLNLLLQVKNQILIVDQPDAELDFDSLSILVQIILKMKSKKQLLFATHNPNLPALGDADQIFFLEQSITELGNNNIEETGIIKNCGSFEKMIDSILNLEGGENAIKKRMEKYLLD